MQRFFSIVMVLCIGLTMSLDANARFGGGKSFGSAPSHQMRQAPTSSPSAAPGAAGAAAAAARPAGGASRWLGPLAGLAAGGLLASMFMGGGFHGMQFFDILIMAIIGFVIFRFIAARRRKQPDMAAAGHTPFQRETHEPPAQASMFGGSSAASAPAPVIQAPAWFNESRFLDAARGHFQSLQQHWDANEMDKIAEFVTPQMLQFLKQERANLGDGFQSTYIDNLTVQLDGLDDRADKTVATLTFSGLSKTSRFDQGEVFSESWNMERPQGDNQPWLVAGIRQNG
ncbi:Tim44 domain-containing protein [Pseudomonas sp. MH10]|uniref:Tim44 domain-containing protein n=1 Tax=Pseudomonas sp. MH10 TaxID=3048627 RepID=UPI002AC92933|nr:Tim44 domain-containing protein [Pseudomonas sp. MH10]MEB0043429.1 Tim44 domain-containing protein [Pseudomonas sp. MH10]WPX62667.1 Tim44 domain-containing protein [Pseudomonas sp. MH10]